MSAGCLPPWIRPCISRNNLISMRRGCCVQWCELKGWLFVLLISKIGGIGNHYLNILFMKILCNRLLVLSSYIRLNSASKSRQKIYLIKEVLFSNTGVKGMMFNATFNNISAISWLSVLLVEKTAVPRENHRPVSSHWQTLWHNVVSSSPLSFFWWRKPEYPEKTTDLSQVTNKLLSHNVVSSSDRHERDSNLQL
jgi:hypothetical protein